MPAEDTNMNEVYLLTGGNIGDRLNYLAKAKKAIENFGILTGHSSVYETSAWGLEEQDAFMNQVVRIQTGLSAENLLTAILQIEESLGRKREIKYGPRVIDIDILLFNDE